ncbi:MAG: hypothetical protein ABH810_03525 [bacterium]
MKRKSKIGIVIIIVFALAGAAAFYLIKKENKKVEPDCETGESTICEVDLKGGSEPTTTKTTVGSFDDRVKKNSSLYKNDKFSFEMTFGSIWNGSKVRETVPSEPAEGKIEFFLPTKDKVFKDGLAPAITLRIFNKSDYKESNNESFEMQLADNGKYVVVYKIWEGTPSDLVQFTEKELSSTAATFKFLN